MCAKMRRGPLNQALKDLGCNKVALGHHFDDAVETFFLSLFFEGRLSCFQPVTNLDRTGVIQIRPMLYLSRRPSPTLPRKNSHPVVHNPCPADKKYQAAGGQGAGLSALGPISGLEGAGIRRHARPPLPEWGPKGRYKRPRDSGAL